MKLTTADAVGRLEMGYETVVLDKHYGPTHFAPIRVRAVGHEQGTDFFGWIIERDDRGPHDDEPKWVEVGRATIGQKDSDYHCGKDCETCDISWEASKSDGPPPRTAK